MSRTVNALMACLGSSNVRGWRGAVKLTDLKVCYERGADIQEEGSWLIPIMSF